MTDVTALVRRWINCSNDLWLRWFASAESGASDFPNIEMSLLNAMVIEKVPACEGLTAERFLEIVRVIYPAPVHEAKQLCVVQGSGNVFCSTHHVSVSAGEVFKVRLIDTMGTMEDGRPYVEVHFGGGYILESPDAIEFAIARD